MVFPRSENSFRTAVQRFNAARWRARIALLWRYSRCFDVSMLQSWGENVDGLVSELSIKKQIDVAGDCSKISVRINSPGGDAFSGIAISTCFVAKANLLRSLWTASPPRAASIIAMAVTKSHGSKQHDDGP